MSHPVLPPSPMPLSDAEFEELLRRVERALVRVRSDADRFFHQVERSLVIIVGPPRDAVMSGMHRLADLLERLLDEVSKILTNPGVPWRVSNAAESWSTEVGARVSALVARVMSDSLKADNRWEGPAAEAYKDALDRQKEALAAIKPITDGIDAALSGASGAIWALWGAVVAALLSLIVAIGTGIIAAMSVVGTPAAVAAVISGAIAAIGLVTAAVTAFVTFVGSTQTAVSQLRQQLTANQGFDGDHRSRHWPVSDTPAFADGHISGQKWKIK
ncbi:hypothetical protein [Planosporangium mesophilum]|uniref:Uncharacterized protein n=1 Tax=Planosporangium mesophilum TaxID=689768 RepID=A0A8J3T5R9_9ACTN|nr:hypothetical protein [Planosporangium mesophilum]NJC81583.1 hypothetical protein [Planosporangium mesophilum]GII20758.1 hypothetical protein Pme01_03550 [Planosporangium mesophilum]